MRILLESQTGLLTLLSLNSTYNDENCDYQNIRYIGLIILEELSRIIINYSAVALDSPMQYLDVYLSSTLLWERQIMKTTTRVYATLRHFKICHLFTAFSYHSLLAHWYNLWLTIAVQSLHHWWTQFTSTNVWMLVFGSYSWWGMISILLWKIAWLKIKSRRFYFVDCLIEW